MLPLTRSFVLIRNTHLADDTFELEIQPADGEPIAPFVAGQWVGLRIPNDPDPKRKIAAFSISNAPMDSKDSYDLAIKIHGERTQMLMDMKMGVTVNVQGPFGMFTLRPGVSRLVFFAGGIGVTPLRSMLRQSLLSGDARELVLFYSNKTRSGTAYEQEFRDLSAAHPNFKYISILTAEQPDGWIGETHRLDTEMIQRHLGGIRPDDEFLMCGPAPFMDAVKQDLIQLGVEPKGRLRMEMF